MSKELQKITKRLEKLLKEDQDFQYKKYTKGEFRKQSEKGVGYIKDLFKEYGYIDKTRFGGMGAVTAWLLVLHAHADHVPFKETYLKAMEEADDPSMRSKRALLVDRILVNKGKPQIYGSQLQDSDNGGKEFASIEDITNIDDMRSSMNLAPLDEYARGFESPPPLPPNYKPK